MELRRHLSIQKQEAENTLALCGWSPEPSTCDSLLQQGSLGLKAQLHSHGCCLPIKFPQHGFSHGRDQKKENPGQGRPHLSFLCLRSFYLTLDTQNKYINQTLVMVNHQGQRKPILCCLLFMLKTKTDLHTDEMGVFVCLANPTQ